jgi:hypothetical protein
VIHLNASFRHNFFEIPIGNGIADIEENRVENNVFRIVSAFKIKDGIIRFLKNGKLSFGLINFATEPCQDQSQQTYHAFFGKYTRRYLAAIVYRFNWRFQLKSLPQRFLIAVVVSTPRPEGWLRMADVLC